jgi:cytochrome P450 / NADPH-cytochrome P450 reductase
MDTTGIPHPANRIPVVGDVVGTSPTTPVQDAMRTARELGPIFARGFFGREVVFVSGADLVEELSDEKRFAKHVAPSLARVRGIAGDGLFTAYNDEPNWQKAHDILLPAFSLQSMRGYHPTMLAAANRLVASWDDHVGRRPVEVADDMTRLTLDTIGLAGFAFDFESFKRPDPHPFVRALVRGLAHVQAKARELPWIGPILNKGADEQFAKDAAYLAQVVDDVIKARKDSGDTSTSDLLGLMLGAPHPVTGEVLDDTNIRNQVITFLIAGHETTSGALSFALHYLVKNPTVLAKARAEVDALWGDQELPQPTYEEVGKLRYVRQVLNEALRLWPTAAAFSREAVVDTTIGKYPIKKGQWVIVLAPMLHRDAVWGDNVEAFDPSRFDPEREKARPVHAFKPFGTGERACIGRQFALHEATLLLGMIIHRYRLLDTFNYQLKVKETLTLKPTGFRLDLAPRTAADRIHPARTATATATKQGPHASGRAKQGTTLTVLHGSNLGTCRAMARQLADEAEDRGFTAVAAPLDSYAGKLPTDGPVVVVAASYNGKPTDDAAHFVPWLNDADDDLSEVSFAVLGVGDRNWAATYQFIPTQIDARLAELGAARLVNRCEADASGDLTGDIESWTDGLWTELLTRYGDPDAEPIAADSSDRFYDVRVITGPVTAALDARYEVVPMTVLANSELVDVESPLGRSKRHLRIALPEGVTYQTGDHLTVVPDNPEDLVRRVAKRFGLDLDLVVAINPRQKTRRAIPVDRPVTIRQLLTHFVELQNPATAAQITVLADGNPCPPEKAALAAMTDTELSLLELLEQNPACQLAPEMFLEMLSPIQARHYSISSSALAKPGEVELIVGVVSGPSRSGEGTYHGVSSYYLSQLAVGDQFRARVDPAREAFRAPADTTVPVIMVSAGTGLAPFRGFIGDRASQRAAGKELGVGLCYFGVRHPDVDYLHRAELETAQEAGVISMRPAFSRAEVDGVKYVQDRIAADSADVWAALSAGGRVYICGDGKGMAPAVREAFKSIHREHGFGDDQQWLDSLIAEDRYVEDVWAG